MPLPSHAAIGGDGADHVLLVEHLAAQFWQGGQDMAQRGAVAAAHVAYKPSAREVVSRSDSGMPGRPGRPPSLHYRRALHPAGYADRQTGSCPGSFMRNTAGERGIDFAPSLPRPRARPEPRGVVQTARRIGAQQPGAWGVRDCAFG